MSDNKPCTDTDEYKWWSDCFRSGNEQESGKVCWFGFDDGEHTCLLLDGHDGPHEPTPDDEIVVSVVEPVDAAVKGET